MEDETKFVPRFYLKRIGDECPIRHRRSPQWPPAKTKVPSSLSLQQSWSFGELHFSIGCSVATKTLRLILPSWRVGLTKEQMGRTRGRPLSINLEKWCTQPGRKPSYTKEPKPNHVLSSVVAFMACKVSTAKVRQGSYDENRWNLIFHQLIHAKKIPPPSGVDMESLEDPAAFEGGHTASLQHIRFGYLIISYPLSVCFHRICHDLSFRDMKQSTSPLYKILHHSYYLIQNASC